MNDLRQAAQQALEALESAEDQLAKPYSTQAQQAITALRAALAEPKQEPDGISWLKRDSGYFTAPTPRKPLHDMAVFDLADEHLYEGGKNYGVLAFARAIELAHGIGEQT